MSTTTSKSGIDILGNVPWGTQICHFYQNSQDLIEILVPYFKAGLENNEFCMWITSEHLSVEEAKLALSKEVNNLDDYIQKGQIEFSSHDEGCFEKEEGSSDIRQVLDFWLDKLKWASTKGFDGVRVTAPTFWLEKNGWRGSGEYEERIKKVITPWRMIVLRVQSLTACGAKQVIDMVSNHSFALVKREGKWMAIQIGEQARMPEKPQDSVESYRKLLNGLVEGCEIIGYDWHYLYVNDSVIRRGGLTREQLTGMTMMEFYPGIENTQTFPVLQRCMKEGSADHIATELVLLDGSRKWFQLSIQPMSEGIVVLSVETTDPRRAEEALRQSEENFRRSVDDSPLGIRVVTADGNTIYANRVLLDI